MAEEHPAGPGTVHIMGEGGGVFELSLPLHETIAEKLAKGHIRRVQPDGTPFVEGDRPEGVPALPESRPALNAVKAEWVGWAVVQGMKPDEAEGLTKADLVERFGAGQVADGTPDGDKSEGDKPEGTPEGTPAE